MYFAQGLAILSGCKRLGGYKKRYMARYMVRYPVYVDAANLLFSVFPGVGNRFKSHFLHYFFEKRSCETYFATPFLYSYNALY